MNMESTPRGVTPCVKGQRSKSRTRHDLRHRAVVHSIAVALLAERLLLAHGSGSFESAEAADVRSEHSSCPAKAQIVQLNVTDLVTEGILTTAQAAGAQDGKWQAVRIDQFLLIN